MDGAEPEARRWIEQDDGVALEITAPLREGATHADTFTLRLDGSCSCARTASGSSCAASSATRRPTAGSPRGSTSA